MPLKPFIQRPRLRRGRYLLFTMIGLLCACAATQKHREGFYHLEAGQYAQGVQELQEAMALDPQNTRYRVDWLQQREEITAWLLGRANREAQAQRFEAAREIYHSILAYDPENARARDGLELTDRQEKAFADMKLATTALKQGNFSLAQTLLTRVFTVIPDLEEGKALQRTINEHEVRNKLTPQNLGDFYKKPVTLEFRDTGLKQVFEFLSKSTGINFILDRDIRADQKTTVFVKQVSLDDVLDMLATTNQLEKKVLNATSVLIYPNTSAKQKEYQDLMVKAFYLGNASAKDTAGLLKTILNLKNVFVDDRLNMLILRDTPEAIALSEKLLALYDLDDPEIMLEVEVLELARSRLLQLGIQVTDTFTVSPLGTTTDSNGVTTHQSINDLLHLNRTNLGVTVPSATIRAHQEDGDVNLLANPRIRVRNRLKAKIVIGDKIPVVTTTTSNTGFVSENVQYLDVGLKLDVEPTVYPNDDISIKMGMEVSTLGAQVQTKSGTLAYQIGNRSADTTLRLHDGETQILAGLIRAEERSSATGLPGITSLPIVGRLFSGHEDRNNKTEIVLSVTPRLVRHIQRIEPDNETFWSGTESVLRSTPLQLRSLSDSTYPLNKEAVLRGTAVSPSGTEMPSKSEDARNGDSLPVSPIKLTWQGAREMKVGSEGELLLLLDSQVALRGLPMQLSYNAAKIDILKVSDEGFFGGEKHQSQFSSTVDKASGRIAVAVGSNVESNPNSGRLLTVRFRANSAGTVVFDLAGIVPVANKPVASPRLPLRYEVKID